jgi:hypothetical protein
MRLSKCNGGDCNLRTKGAGKSSLINTQLLSKSKQMLNRKLLFTYIKKKYTSNGIHLILPGCGTEKIPVKNYTGTM